jgi:hypothetical protein
MAIRLVLPDFFIRVICDKEYYRGVELRHFFFLDVANFYLRSVALFKIQAVSLN